MRWFLLIGTAIMLLLASASIAEDQAQEFGAPDFTGWPIYSVTGVLNGDIICIEHDGEEYFVRMLGVDAPDIWTPDQEPEYYSKEAFQYTASLLTGAEVYLEADQGDSLGVDESGFLLAYVWRVADTLCVNMALVENGYGRYSDSGVGRQDYAAQFQECENQAKARHMGLWMDSAKPVTISISAEEAEEWLAQNPHSVSTLEAPEEPEAAIEEEEEIEEKPVPMVLFCNWTRDELLPNYWAYYYSIDFQSRGVKGVQEYTLYFFDGSGDGVAVKEDVVDFSTNASPSASGHIYASGKIKDYKVIWEHHD